MLSDYHVVVVHGDGDDGGSWEPPFVALTDDEVDRCLSMMTDTQHRAAFRLMVDLGLGPAELFGEGKAIRGLFIKDIDSRGMVLKIHHRTSTKEPYSVREVPLTGYALTAIKDFLFSSGRNLHDTFKLFDITDRRFRQVLTNLSEKVALGKQVTVVVLRRTAIFKMLREGVQPDEIRRRIGILREKEEMLIYAVAFVFNDPTMYDRLIKQAVYETLVTGRPPGMLGSGFSAPRPAQ